MHTLPKISIITVVYNSAALIERTIKSVLGQSYANIEYVIIDGASTDATLSIVKQYQTKIAVLVSEKDKGIYDAMNKGLAAATGDYVLFLNAGDELYNTTTIANVFDLKPNADVYYGNTLVTDSSGIPLGDRRLTSPEQLNWKSLKYGMCVSHQSFIAKRILCTSYNTNYHIAADIDWVISVLKKSVTVINCHQYISKFLEGGASNKHQAQGLKERFGIMSAHYGLLNTLWNHFYILMRYPVHKFTRKSMT